MVKNYDAVCVSVDGKRYDSRMILTKCPYGFEQEARAKCEEARAGPPKRVAAISDCRAAPVFYFFSV